MAAIIGTVQCRYKAVNFSQKSRKRHHSSPVRASYGVSFVDTISDLYSAPMTDVMYAISCNIWSHYDGTRLYKDSNDKGKRTFLYVTNPELAALLHRRLLIQNFNAFTVVNLYKYLMQIYFIVKFKGIWTSMVSLKTR